MRDHKNQEVSTICGFLKLRHRNLQEKHQKSDAYFHTLAINNNNLLHFIALFWLLKALYIAGGNLLNHHQGAASFWIMRRQPYCVRTPTTHTQSDEANQCMGMIRPWWSEANGEIWPGCRGYTPTLFLKDILGFLMTTESQDLGLTSHTKDGLNKTIFMQNGMQMMIWFQMIVNRWQACKWERLISILSAIFYFHRSVISIYLKKQITLIMYYFKQYLP